MMLYSSNCKKVLTHLQTKIFTYSHTSSHSHRQGNFLRHSHNHCSSKHDWPFQYN